MIPMNLLRELSGNLSETKTKNILAGGYGPAILGFITSGIVDLARHVDFQLMFKLAYPIAYLVKIFEQNMLEVVVVGMLGGAALGCLTHQLSGLGKDSKLIKTEKVVSLKNSNRK